MLMNLSVLIVISYLAGSIPFGLMIGRFVKGIDLRQYGSGNIGATNAGRVLGKKWGLICLALDALKGLLPVAFFPSLVTWNEPTLMSEHLRVVAGISTVVGHMFPCWLGFRGGKGVATSLGVVAMLSPWGMLVGAATFFGTFAIWRIVSLSSMLAAVAFGAYQLLTLRPTPFANEVWSQGVFAILVPLLIVIQHRSNLRRLLAGQEPRFQSGSSGESHSSEKKTEG